MAAAAFMPLAEAVYRGTAAGWEDLSTARAGPPVVTAPVAALLGHAAPGGTGGELARPAHRYGPACGDAFSWEELPNER